MLIFLYGADTFRSRAQMKKMLEKFKKDRDPSGYNSVRLDVKKDANRIMGELLSAPFLAERRMIVVENLLARKEKELLQALLKRIEEQNLPESNIILLWEEGEEFKDKDAKKLFERLVKEKYTQKFDKLIGVRLTAWIDEEFKARGGKIDQAAVRYLAENINGDTWRLNSLIDQLISYSYKWGNTNTEAEKRDSSASPTVMSGSVGMTVLGDVQLFLDKKVDDNIFNLVDAIAAKQPKNVFAMIAEQYRKGEDAGYIFAMILRQYRILLEMRDLFDREDNLPSDLMAKKLGIHPFVVKKSLPIMKQYSWTRLQEIYQKLLEIDIKTKTGRGDQSVLLDIFVGQVSSG